MRGSIITLRTAIAVLLGALLVIVIQHTWPSQTAFITKDYSLQRPIINADPEFDLDDPDPTATLQVVQPTPQGVQPTTAAQPSGGGMWGPAGPAPSSFTGTAMYNPDGSGTVIGWIVPGPTDLPSGVCMDYDPRSETSAKPMIEGPHDVIFTAPTSKRVRMTGDGRYVGQYPATVYWTPC